MNAFKRLEFKYYIPLDVAADILRGISEYTLPDEYGDAGGSYTISSIYFDNDRYDYYYQTINGDIFRQKLRLRSYGGINSPQDTVYFEIKSKFDGQSTKRRIPMPYDEAMSFAKAALDSGFSADSYLKSVITYNPPQRDVQVLREVAELIRRDGLRPVSVVSYERQALIDAVRSDVRITFDSRLRVRTQELDLLSGTHGMPTMAEDMLVLEVKQDSNVPLWLSKILSKHLCQNQTYSKYCSYNMVIPMNLLSEEKINAATV